MPDIKVRTEPLTYARERRNVSFFADFITATRGNVDAQLRQARHRDEMRVELPALENRRRQASEQRADTLGLDFEFRVSPSRTLGQGGEFSPPLWINEMFATAPRVGRVITDPRIGTPIFDTPPGVQSINLPRLTTGNIIQPTPDLSVDPEQDIVDAAVSSPIVAFTGQSDVAIQLLEQSPQGAHFDWVTWTDLIEAYVQDFETMLLTGIGTVGQQFVGLLNVPGITIVSYVDGSPKATAMFPFVGRTVAAIGIKRHRPPEAWLYTTARHAWLATSEDAQNRPLGLADYQGVFPVGSLIGYPVFLDDVVPTNLTLTGSTFVTGGTQDVMIAFRPSDLIVFEGQPRVSIMPEPLSGTLEVRLQLRSYGAAILGRQPTGIAVLGDTGMATQPGFT